MLSKAKIKAIKSLAQKKHRKDAGLFVAEGTKIVGDLLHSSFEIVELYATADWLASAGSLAKIADVVEVSGGELERLSDLTTPHQVLAVVRVPGENFHAAAIVDRLVLALDDLQDPGNLGTILRACDWFGVEHIIASGQTVDCFNPKVVQASMGSIARVRVHYREDLAATLRELKTAGKPIYAATLDGENIYRAKIDPRAVVVFGNEGQGLRPEIVALSTRRISVPSFNANITRAESLNVALAASIVCGEFRRR